MTTDVIKTPKRRSSNTSGIEKNTSKHTSVISEVNSPSQIKAKIKKIKEENVTINHEYEPTFVFEEYTNLRSLKRIPINNIWIDALAKEMVRWIDEDVDVIRFDEFLQKKSMLETEFKRLAAQSPILKRAWEYCLRGIARNREVGAWKRGKNWAVASYNLPYYCDITKEESKRRAKLREESAGESGTKIVVIPSIEEFERELSKKETKE